jgi:hypothetical protein
MKDVMKQIDFKSMLIGVLSSVLVFVLVGAKKTPESLGDIVVDSIQIVDGGDLKILNKAGKPTGVFSSDEDGGVLRIMNKEGKFAATLGNYENGGRLGISNKEGKIVAVFPN